MVSNFFAIQAGLLAGISMGIVAMMLNMLKLTSLNLTEYVGCLITRKKSGPIPLLIGFITHLIASVMFAFIYLHIITYFSISLTLMHSILLGLVHTAFSGSILLAIDMIHPCVKSKKISAIGILAYNYGIMGTCTYILIHIVYSITLIKIFELESLLAMLAMFSLISSQVKNVQNIISPEI